MCDVIGLDAEYRQKLLDRDAGYVAHYGVKNFFHEEFSKKFKALGIKYNTWHQVQFRLIGKRLKWGSEIRTCLNFKWSIRGWFANGTELEWDLKTSQNGCHLKFQTILSAF